MTLCGHWISRFQQVKGHSSGCFRCFPRFHSLIASDCGTKAQTVAILFVNYKAGDGNGHRSWQELEIVTASQGQPWMKGVMENRVPSLSKLQEIDSDRPGRLRKAVTSSLWTSMNSQIVVRSLRCHSGLVPVCAYSCWKCGGRSVGALSGLLDTICGKFRVGNLTRVRLVS